MEAKFKSDLALKCSLKNRKLPVIYCSLLFKCKKNVYISRYLLFISYKL